MTLDASEEASPMSKRGLHAEEQPMERVFGMSSELQGGQSVWAKESSPIG